MGLLHEKAYQEKIRPKSRSENTFKTFRRTNLEKKKGFIKCNTVQRQMWLRAIK